MVDGIDRVRHPSDLVFGPESDLGFDRPLKGLNLFYMRHVRWRGRVAGRDDREPAQFAALSERERESSFLDNLLVRVHHID